MAFSTSPETGDGIQVTFPFSFTGPDNGYIKEADIQVFVDDILVTNWTLTGPTQVTFDVAPADQAAILIRRIVDKTKPYTDFTKGNNFGKDNVNNSFNQQLYVAHEFMDGYTEDGFYWKQDMSMGGFRMTDFATPTEDTDVATKGYVDAIAPSSEADRIAAEAAAAAALVSENNAATSENNADTRETNAQLAEDKAEAWAEEDEDVEVETGKYSAKHWSAKAEQTAASINVGTAIGDLVALVDAGGGTPGFPAVDGSNLTGVIDATAMHNLSDDLTPELGGNLNCADYTLTRPRLKDTGYQTQVLGAITTATNLSYALGEVINCTIGADLTFTFSSPPSNAITGIMILEITNGGAFTITWPTSVVWDGGSAPILQFAGTDIITFITRDAGTTWRAVRGWKEA
jgi:hypothetical protein